MRSQDMLEHLQEELGADFELNYNSYNMQIISNQIEWDASAQLVNDFKLPGFEAKLIDSYESHLLEPLRHRGHARLDLCSESALSQPHKVCSCLPQRNAAVKHGAKFVNGAEVTEILHEGARVIGAKAKGECWYAGTTINCTGVVGEGLPQWQARPLPYIPSEASLR